MQQQLDIRITFLCRTTRKNESGKSPIILRIVYRGERRDIFTGLYCFHCEWDGTAKKVTRVSKDSGSINKNLDIIFIKANNSFDQLKFSDQPFTLDELVEKIKGKEAKPTTLVEFLENGLEKIKQKIGTEIIESTYSRYKRGVDYLKAFILQKHRVKDLTLQKVNKEFLEAYFQYLRSTVKNEYNTAAKYMRCIKTLLAPGVQSSHIKPDALNGLRTSPKLAAKEVLTQEEIDTIANLEIESPDLNRKRDIFLFACYTGLAYIDLKQLSSLHLIQSTDQSWYIHKPRQKTGQNSIIPLLPAAVRILSKYSPTGNIKDFRMYISSNQKMNKGMREIESLANIPKKLHMHLARHTFATTITLANGIPIETVSKMLGHSTINQTQHYAKIVPLKIKRDMETINHLFQ